MRVDASQLGLCTITGPPLTAEHLKKTSILYGRTGIDYYILIIFIHHIGRHTRKNRLKLECGPMPNVMAALSNVGGALCSTPQSLADAHH